MQPSASPRPPSRRGPSLSVRTNSPATNSSSTESLPRPSRTGVPPMETAYSRFSESSESQPTLTAVRRQSKLNFRLFARNSRSQRPDATPAVPEDAPEAPTPELTDTEALSASPDASRDASRERTNSTRAKSKKAKHRQLMATDPPPLFQAYPQAVKEGHLLAPVHDAETVLRNRSRQSSEADHENAAGAENADGSPNPEMTKEMRKKINKRRTSAPLSVPCAPKLYILTTSGWLLQYADNGCHNRLPERIMQLRKDSAAFASDAIPGKHWVLQISQSSTEDGAVLDAPRQSVFSKLSFGQDMKKPVGAFLLVMNSAEEMNSWLVTIRKEIQSLGGLEYRPDERAMSNATSGRRPSSDPQTEGQRPEVRQRTVSQRASMYSLRSPPGGGLPPSSFPAARPELGLRQTSTGSILSKRASMYAISPTSQPQARSHNWQPLVAPHAPNSPKRSPLRASFNLDKALPERPVDDAQARIDALGIINAEKLRRSHSGTRDELTLNPHNIKQSSLQSPKSPKFPVSAYNPDAHKFSMDSPRQSFDAIRHHRFSFEKNAPAPVAAPQPVSRPSHDTIDSSRTRTSSSAAPSLTDGESAPQESLPGDVPVQDASRLTISTEATPTAASHGSVSQSQAVRIEVQQMPIAAKAKARRSSDRLRTRASRDTKVAPTQTADTEVSHPHGPKRYASFDHSHIHAAKHSPPLQQAPYPLPKSQLPPMKLEPMPPARPNSAQGAAQRSISPMPTGQGLRRPTSHQPNTPGRTPPTPQLPVGKPLTIQERRRLSHRPIIVGPPTAPPPTSPLPELPKPAVNTAGAPAAPPTPPPFKETPPTLTASHFPQQPRKLPDSPPATVAPHSSVKPVTGTDTTGSIPRIYQDDDLNAHGVTIAPEESWGQ